MDMKKNIFGQRIFELRSAAGMTQGQLGEEVGLTPQAINDIEKGRRNTTFPNLVALAEHFNVSVDYLLGLIDDPSPENHEFAAFKKSWLDKAEEIDACFKELRDIFKQIPETQDGPSLAYACELVLFMSEKHLEYPWNEKYRDVFLESEERNLIHKIRSLPPEKRKAVETLLNQL